MKKKKQTHLPQLYVLENYFKQNEDDTFKKRDTAQLEQLFEMENV